MNVVVMTSRSGSSLVCKILAEHGLRWQDGKHNPSQAARGDDSAGYFTYEHPSIKAALKKTTPNGKWPLGDMVRVTNRRINIMKGLIDTSQIDFVKSGVEFADLWRAWGAVVGENIHFIKVYRPPEDVADSIARRGIGKWDAAFEIVTKRFDLMRPLEGWWVLTKYLAAPDAWPSSGIVACLKDTAGYHDPELIMGAIEPGKFHG